MISRIVLRCKCADPCACIALCGINGGSPCRICDAPVCCACRVSGSRTFKYQTHYVWCSARCHEAGEVIRAVGDNLGCPGCYKPDALFDMYCTDECIRLHRERAAKLC